MAGNIIPQQAAPIALEQITDVNGMTFFIPLATAQFWRARGFRQVHIDLIIDAGEAPQQWLTVQEAARLHLDDIDDITLSTAKGSISRAAKLGHIASNGKSGRDRRLDPASVDAWRLARREKQLKNYDG